MEEKSRILIVDDIEMNTKMASLALKRPEYAITKVHSGAEALDAVAKEKYDLILLDIMMPEMDGYSVCRTLKENPATEHIPVVFLTARSDVDSIRQAFEAGGNDYINKPFQKAELLARVDTQIRLRKHMEQIETVSNERKQLLHILTHDLANPIGASLAVLSMIEEDPDYLQDGKPILQSALQNGARIIHLVRKFRALEEPERVVRCNPENLLDMIDESVGMLVYLWKPKNQRIRVDIDPKLHVSVDRVSFINSVVNNLLSNAVKFSHPGSEIIIEGRLDGEQSVRLTVLDHGIGIPPEMLEIIFSLNATTGRAGTEGETGTGYGMPLVKRFIEAYGGTIKIESTGKGTTVTCILKAARR